MNDSERLALVRVDPQGAEHDLDIGVAGVEVADLEPGERTAYYAGREHAQARVIFQQMRSAPLL